MVSKTICIAGKNNIAINIAQYVLDNFADYKIVSIINQNDNGKNHFQLSYKLFCENNNIEIVQLKDIYPIENLIFLSLEFDRIIKPRLFKTRELFNIHFSLLPAYKGMYTSALPIINGENKSGVTLHKIDVGIDTGNIIAQTSFKIDFKMTGQELYNKYINYGTDLIKKNLVQIIQKNYTETPQPIQGASYYSKSTIDYQNLVIDLNKTAFEIYNQIRAFSFPAYQLPIILGNKIYHSRILNQKSKDKPSTVQLENDYEKVISTIDYDLCLLKDRQKELFNAAKEGNINFVKEMISNKYPIEQRSKEGWDILIISAYNGKYDFVKWLIEDLKWNQNSMNNNKTSFAMYVMTNASTSDDIQLLKYIKENCAEINWNHKDAYGYDILHYAKKLSNSKVLNILCQ